MKYIKTWAERCEEHPDHNGIVTERMIQARMQEEIDDLRAALAEPVAEPVQEQDIEDAIEAAYWQFDCRRSGLNEWASAPQSERDAFKAEARKLVRGYFPTRQAQDTKREMLAVADAFIRGKPAPREFLGLTLKEMDEIIDGNIKITDSRLRDGVYGVVLDTISTLLEKNPWLVETTEDDGEGCA